VRATKVNAGLAESNGRLLLGIWRDSLHVTCGLTACTSGSAPGPTLGKEYGKTLPLLLGTCFSRIITSLWYTCSQCQCQCQSKIFDVARSPRMRSRITELCLREKTDEKRMTTTSDSREVRTHVYWLFYICIYTWVDMYTQRLKVTVTIGGAGAFNV